MKKIFTLAVIATMAFAASAADFELFFGDTPAHDGDHFSRGYTTTVIEQNGRTIYKYEQNANLFVKGERGAAVTVTVTADKALSVCSIDGQCDNLSAANNFTAVKSGAFTGELEDLRIDRVTTKANDKKPSLDIINAKVTVVSGSKSVTVTVELTNEEAAGIAAVIDSDDYLRLAGRQLRYRVTAPCEISVYNILGGCVVTSPISGEGSLSLANLPKGVYLYRAGSLTGKILIK